MNSKVSFCTCSSPSCVLLKTKKFDSALTKDLFRAQQKLIPVINTVIGSGEGNSKDLKRSYYLSLQQYEDIVWAQKILREFNQTHLNLSKDSLFDLETRSIKTNKLGQVYVDTPVLLQLIELHKMLGHIIQAVKQKPVDSVTSSVQTDLSGQSTEQDSVQLPPQIDDSELLELQDEKKPLRINNFSNKKQTDFFVMYSTDEIPATTSQQDQSKVSTEVTDIAGARKIIIQCLSDLNKVKTFLERDTVDVSTDNLSRHSSKLASSPDVKSKRAINTDQPVYEVPTTENNITEEDTERCEFDLGSEKMTDSSRIVICIRDKDDCQGAVEVIIKQCSWCKELEQQELKASRLAENEYNPEEKRFAEKSVCVCDEGKPVTEVIVTELENKSTAEKSIARNKNLSKTSVVSSGRYEQRSKIEQKVEYNSTTNTSRDIKTDEFQTTSTEISKSQIGKITEVHIIHGDQDTCTCTTSTDSEKLNSKINVIFNPEDPVNSVVEPPDIIQKKASSKVPSEPVRTSSTAVVGSISTAENIRSESKSNIRDEVLYPTAKTSKRQNSGKLLDQSSICSRIKLCETANLCFSTPNGEELIVSLTIRPNNKSGNAPPGTKPKKLSLKDIFSDSDGVRKEEVIKRRSTSQEISRTQSRMSQISSKRADPTDEDHLILEVKSADKIEEGEGIIPLPKTRICSSLEFDVTVVDTRLRTTGIKHFNPNVVVKLREFGVDNILRACRPAKCCRKAVLNEKLRKCLPYPASLKSLPLDDNDIDTIKDSFELSLKNESEKEQRNKIQQYTALVKNYPKIKFPFTIQNDKYIYHCSITRQMQSQARIFKDYFLRKKLSYYINLVHDVNEWYPAVEYRVFYFEIQSKNVADILLKVPSPILHTNTRTELENNNNLIKKKTKVNKKGIRCSKIPIYKFKNNIKHSESLMYNVSLRSLPSVDDEKICKSLNKIILREHENLNPSSETKCSQGLKAELLHILNSKVFKQCESSERSFFDKLPRSYAGSSKTSNQSLSIYSHPLGYKPKRKKQQFCLSKSRSEVSIKTTKTLVHFNTGGKKFSNKYVCVNSQSSLINKIPKGVKKEVGYDENLKVLLDYFVDLFFNFMVKEIAEEIKERSEIKKVPRTVKSIIHFKENIESTQEKVNDDLKCCHSKTKSQISIHTNTNSLPDLEDKGLQTETFDQSTLCLQTSVANLTDVLVQFPEKKVGPTKIIQEKEAESFLSKIDSRFDLLYGCNNWSRIGLNEETRSNCDNGEYLTAEECISKSMLKLQEYDTYMRNMCQFSPIDFLVYQNYLKSPCSFLSKFMCKSKNASTLGPCKCREEELKIRYKNEKSLQNASRQDCKICDKCSCYLDMCGEKDSGLTKYCSCPQSNKSSKHKSNKNLKRVRPCGHWLSPSFVKAASKKSINYLKKSISAVFKSNKNKGQKASLCACSRPKKDEQVTACYNPKLQDFSACANLSQPKTCRCKKCTSFTEEGCCKCSHCLKELDKSIATEVKNNHVGVTANQTKENVKEKGSDDQKTEGTKKTKIKQEPKEIEPKIENVKYEPEEIEPKVENVEYEPEEIEPKIENVKNEPTSDESFEDREIDDIKYEESQTFYFTVPPPKIVKQFNQLGLSDLENGIWTFAKMNFCPEGSSKNKEPKIVDITAKPIDTVLVENVEETDPTYF